MKLILCISYIIIENYMGTFFNTTHANYYIILANSSETLANSISSIVNNSSLFAKSIERISSYVLSADLSGSGYEYLASDSLPAILNRANTFCANVNLLSTVSSLVKKLVKNLEKLKNEDAKYENAILEYNTAQRGMSNSWTYPQKRSKETGNLYTDYNEKVKVQPDWNNYERMANNASTIINNSSKRCEELILTINENISAIKGINITDFSVGNLGYSLGPTDNEKMILQNIESFDPGNEEIDEGLTKIFAESSYNRVVKNSFGRVLYAYQQRKQDNAIDNQGNIYSFTKSGCGPTALATILSCVNKDIDPLVVFVTMGRKAAIPETIRFACERFGINAGEKVPLRGNNKELYFYSMVAEIEKGNPVICNVSSDFSKTNNNHFVAIYDTEIDKLTGERYIYVADPATNRNLERLSQREFMKGEPNYYMPIGLSQVDSVDIPDDVLNHRLIKNRI